MVERAAARDLGAAAERSGGFTCPIAGGMAIFAGENSPLTKVVGVGFEPFEPEALAPIEARFFDLGAAVTVELPTLADADVAQSLAHRGYRLQGFEDVLVCSLAAGVAKPASGDAVSCRGSDDEELEAWLDVLVEGFAHPDGGGPEVSLSFPRETVRAAVRALATTSRRFVGLREGHVVAAASMSVVDDVAFLSGSATLPDHRRRGLQSALLAHRLREAKLTGATQACVATAPGSRSKQNAMRRGFTNFYTRAVRVRFG